VRPRADHIPCQRARPARPARNRAPSRKPPACVAAFHAAGNSTIFDGTGGFAGIAGTGTFTSHGVFFAHRTPQGCSKQGTAIDIVQDHGTVTLG
jgi:hypothetical protein